MTSVIAYDVAYAKRLVPEDYTFDMMVTVARMKRETVETVQRAIQAYQYESGHADVLDMDLDNVVSSVEERCCLHEGRAVGGRKELSPRCLGGNAGVHGDRHHFHCT